MEGKDVAQIAREAIGVIEGLEFALSNLEDLISGDDDEGKAEGEGHATE